jgi:hypothetical protein
LTLWDVERRMRLLITQARVARSEENFPEGLLSEERRKTGSMRRKPHVMIERAIAAKAAFSFVAADTVYGVGDIETALGRAGKGWLCARREIQCPVSLLGQATDRRRNRERDRRRLAGLRVAACFGGRGKERRAVARLGLSSALYSRQFVTR